MGQNILGTPLPTSALPSGSPAGPTGVRYAVLGAACSVAVLSYVHRQGFATALPELKLSPIAEGWLQAMFLLAYGGFEVPSGLLGDRLGVRNVLTLFVLGWSLMTGCVALVGLLPDVWMLPLLFLLVVRFLFGMFQAGGFPSLSRMMTDWMPLGQRASAQGLIWMSSRLGAMIVPYILLGLMWVCGGQWQAPLWILAGIGVLWCAAFWPWFRNRPEEMPAINMAERELIAAGRGTASSGHGAVPWAKMFRSRSVWCLCLMYGFGGFAASFYITLLPAYLKRYCPVAGARQESVWLQSLPFAFGLVACLGGGLLSDWIIRRTGNRKRGRRLQGSIAMLVGGLGWMALGFAPDVLMLAVLLCLIFFCNDLSMGPAWASCADIGEQYAGTLGGAMNMIGNLTAVIGSLLAGYLFAVGKTHGVFIIYGCSFWLASLCWLGVDVTRPLEEKLLLTAGPE